MNVSEFGLVLNVMVSYDISGFTNLGMDFTRPDGSTFSVVKPAVSVGTVALPTTTGSFAANQYATYTFADGNLNQAGVYTVRVNCSNAAQRLVSDPVTFTVNA